MGRLILAIFLAPVAGFGRTSIVLIVSDDQGYGDISCYDHPDEVSTPNLNRLAAEGARMTSGYASCPVCALTRAGGENAAFGPESIKFKWSTPVACSGSDAPALPGVLVDYLLEDGKVARVPSLGD